MTDRSDDQRPWYDPADVEAWPTAVAVFVLAAIVFALLGLGFASLLAALALGFAALNLKAARNRREHRGRT
jgi:hypothetical protein